MIESKPLLHAKELISASEQGGYTISPVNLHWRRNKAKLEIALAKGKKQHDKRATIKECDWERQKARLLKGYAPLTNHSKSH